MKFSPRTTLNLNRQWRFHLGDCVSAHTRNFDDSDWTPIGLPHTFDLPYFRAADFYVGAGWYRKTIHAPAEWLKKRLFLEFQGAFQTTDVYVNGIKMARHEGGYTGFSIEITDAIKPGENVLAIKVDNTWNPQLVPRAGEHIFSGGLYRDVNLVIKNPLHITWHGVWATTPSVSAEAGSVNVKTEICNRTPSGKTCRLLTQLHNPEGDVVASTQSTQFIDAAATIEIEQSLPPIRNPKLWHPDHPDLYTVHVRLFANELTDESFTPLGFRWFQWTPDRGFFLNGQHLYLRGANAHQDHSGWGIAITQGACHRDAKLIKDAGFNFVRGAHYPHHPAFADACDQLGLIFWSEACFWGKGGFGPEGYWNASAYPINEPDREPFERSCLTMLQDMIRINRNHPSILIWSMTNEAFFTYDLDRTRALITTMVNLSRRLDPTRPVAVGGAQRGQVDKLADVAGYNGDGARLFLKPCIANLVSEYGAISKPIDAYDPFFGDLQQERFSWRSGEAIWCAFDYGSIAGKQGLKGILQHNRLPKQSWHWYRNHLLKIPPPPPPVSAPPARLEISADKSVMYGTDATDDCQIVVTALDAAGNRVTQSPPITLAIESGPGEFPTGRSITFDAQTDIPIAQGQAAIAFRSYFAGQTHLRATSTGLADATFTITTLGEPQYIEGQSPIAPDRPYTSPQPSQAALNAMKNAVNVARDRPSIASSESDSHPARHANDVNLDTYWEAQPTDSAPWLRIDLEGFYNLSTCRLVFAKAGNYRYRIDISLDANQWTPAIDRTQSVRTDPIRNDVFDPGTTVRYIRITFTSMPDGPRANLCELELLGVLCPK